MVENNVMWNLFLANKSRTGRTHYNLRRTCGKCGKPICDKNRGGYCAGCAMSPLKSRGRVGEVESSRHKELKEIAKKFLWDIGCEDIREEVRLGGNLFRSDVVGRLNNEKIAVECGGSLTLEGKFEFVDKLFILPYGESVPFLWERGTQVCRTCGHKV